MELCLCVCVCVLVYVCVCIPCAYQDVLWPWQLSSFSTTLVSNSALSQNMFQMNDRDWELSLCNYIL